jgi:deoxycytidine triphosphate deaminase
VLWHYWTNRGGKVSQSESDRLRGEAHSKWAAHKEHDPLPNVPQTLLSRADILHYVDRVGLIYPFFADKDRLKWASYEIGFGSTFIYWDEHGEKVEKKIQKDGVFTLPANSISFVDLESDFFLPRYIGARFNLRIQHVHRGLLLGTGPLVDPGFNGNLLVPLHNLTSDPYVIRGDEGFIWVEFTKTSFEGSAAAAPLTQGDLDAWERRKNNMLPALYFDKANKNKPIRSSIPDAAAKATAHAASAEAAATRAQRANTIFVGLGALTIAGTVIALLSFFESINGNVISAVSLAKNVNDIAVTAATDAKFATQTVNELKSQVDKLNPSAVEVQQLRSKLDTLSVRIDELDKNIRDQSNKK